MPIPTAPAGLVATNIRTNKIELSWTLDGGVHTSENIYRGGTLLQKINAGLTTFTDESVSANTAYSYTVKSENGSGESLDSNTCSITTLAIPTLTTLIRGNKAIPIRRLYIKRRSVADVYETDWYRIDNYNLIDRVTNWGSVSIEIDEEQFRIAAFNISNMTIGLSNADGIFNSENDSRSLWYGYLNRKFTKFKVDAGYLDQDGNEVGLTTVFEGVLNELKINDDQKSTASLLSYQSVLQSYDVKDLSFTGEHTINYVVDAIMNQSKITKFIPYVAAAADQNVTLTDISTLTGKYWDVIKELAVLSNSVPYMNCSAFSFQPRTPSVSSAFDFKGAGVRGYNDIYKVSSFDDEGAKRVRLHWIVTGTNIEAKSVDATLLKKYLGEPESLDLSEVKLTADKQAIVNALLAQWEDPKPVIDFETKYTVSILKPLDKITIDIRGQITPLNTFVWGGWKWGDGSKWGKQKGSIIITSTRTWKILKVSHNIDGWKTQIKAEEIIA